jgi:FkbM family methyltransferase
MKVTIRKVYSILLKLIPKRLHDKFIKLTISILKQTDILVYAYNSIGILKWQNEEISGEAHVINDILPKYINKEKTPILFDVGANIGNYSIMLKEKYPLAKICSFEPNPYSFAELKENLKGSNIEVYNFGFGQKKGKENLYVYKKNTDSQHASLYKEFGKVINSELGKEEKIHLEIGIITIDSFCVDNNINNIDFIKIDVEGHEFAVLQGALNMINHNRIKIIQFEFNVANILSKVFLKDFYELLGMNFEFYRLDTTRLIYLGDYDSINEIFKYQNILALNKEIVNE